VDSCRCRPKIEPCITDACKGEKINAKCVIYDTKTISNLKCFLGLNNKVSAEKIFETLDAKLCEHLLQFNVPECARILLGLPEKVELNFALRKVLDYLCLIQDTKVKVSETDKNSGYLFDKIVTEECLKKEIVETMGGNQVLRLSIDYICLKSKIPTCIEVNCDNCNGTPVSPPSQTCFLPIYGTPNRVCSGNNSLVTVSTTNTGANIVQFSSDEGITWIDGNPNIHTFTLPANGSLHKFKARIKGCTQYADGYVTLCSSVPVQPPVTPPVIVPVVQPTAPVVQPVAPVTLPIAPITPPVVSCIEPTSINVSGNLGPYVNTTETYTVTQVGGTNNTIVWTISGGTIIGSNTNSTLVVNWGNNSTDLSSVSVSVGCTGGTNPVFSYNFFTLKTNSTPQVPVTSPVEPPVILPVTVPVTAPVTVPTEAPVDFPIAPFDVPISPIVIVPFDIPITPFEIPIAPFEIPVESPVEVPVEPPVTVPVEVPVTPVDVPTAPIYNKCDNVLSFSQNQITCNNNNTTTVNICVSGNNGEQVEFNISNGVTSGYQVANVGLNCYNFTVPSDGTNYGVSVRIVGCDDNSLSHLIGFTKVCSNTPISVPVEPPVVVPVEVPIAPIVIVPFEVPIAPVNLPVAPIEPPTSPVVVPITPTVSCTQYSVTNDTESSLNYSFTCCSTGNVVQDTILFGETKYVCAVDGVYDSSSGVIFSSQGSCSNSSSCFV
jgi:hypothetical protein